MQKYIECKRDNLVLRGMAHIPENIDEKVPAIIMFHGFSASRVGFAFQFVQIARELEKHGIATFRFDLVGSGESDGEFQDVTLTSEIADGEAIIDYVKSLDYIDKNRIGLMGMSFGGMLAAMLGGIRNDDIKSLFLAASATCAIDDIRKGHVQGKLINDEKVKERGFLDLHANKVGPCYWEDCVKYNPIKVASGFKKNALVMHIKGDPMVPAKCSEELCELYGDRAELVLVEGESHSFDTVEKVDALQEGMVKFFTKEFAI
ncbi:alpha/beta hydrolase family protein [Intestinibacter sp.]